MSIFGKIRAWLQAWVDWRTHLLRLQEEQLVELRYIRTRLEHWPHQPSFPVHQTARGPAEFSLAYRQAREDQN